MGWTLAEDWLTVMGLLLLTLGTGAQARASMREFTSLWRDVPDRAEDQTAKLKTGLRSSALFAAALIPVVGPIFTVLSIVQGSSQLARYLRLALVWGVIMVGSALTLAAAVIQLVLA